MWNATLAFLRRPTTMIGIATALMFQVIFGLVWLTGYKGVSDNFSLLKLALVHEDPAAGSTIAQQIVSELPFEIRLLPTIDEAEQLLRRRQVHLVVHIPSGFAEQLQSREPAALRYMLNESNPMLLRNLVESIANQITQRVNQTAVQRAIQSFFLTMDSPDLSSEQLSMTAAVLSERVTADMQTIHPVSRFSSQMIPMMSVIASYVGTMVMGMNLLQSSLALRPTMSRWRRYIAWGLINLAASPWIALVGASPATWLGGPIHQGFLSFWLFQTLLVLVFLFVSQMFLILFGMAGMLLHILVLSLQLVASGTMVPRELLPDLFQRLGTILPATYGTQGMMNILFGGTGQPRVILLLVLFIIGSIVIGACRVALEKEAFPQPAPTPHPDMVK